MQMEAGLDTGPVLMREATNIGAEETTGDLHDRLSAIGARLIVETLRQIETLTPAPQPEEGVTYAFKIDKSEARVDWSRPASEVDCHIRGLSPFPGAWTDAEGERVKLLRTRLSDGNGEPGKHLGGFRIACGKGSIEVRQAQRQGKRPMSSEELLRGMELPVKFT